MRFDNEPPAIAGLQEPRSGRVDVQGAAITVLTARVLPPPDRLLEQVDLDVRHRDDFLAPALNDPRSERIPCGGVERLQRFLVPAGNEEGKAQEDAGTLENLYFFPRRVDNPDPGLFGVVREK